VGKATLIDTTKCIGCRSCQVSCKQWNNLPGEITQLQPALGLQNPARVSAKTLTVVTYSELPDAKAQGGLRYLFTKRQCMHCEDPACATACPVTALKKTSGGAVTYDAAKCIGCRYCIWACPFGAPTADWDTLAPKIHKCSMCDDRETPACVQQCPAGALKHGERAEILQEARARIAAHPGKYVDHIYGEREAGGTSMLYLASVPFQKLGLPNVGNDPYPKHNILALAAVPPAVLGLGATLGGATAALARRKAKVAREERHAEFAPLAAPKSQGIATRLLLALMAFGGLSFAARFAFGLGGSTNLNDTSSWGLWISFDLVWIAVAAGAFATAGLIYVLRREDLYSVGRSAVLMGLLSYSFVTMTLLADLGLPWHFWRLGTEAPKHSAMFEVSWCVGLYVTILALEFVPVVLEKLQRPGLAAIWKKWAPIYVVGAMTLFVWLLSRNPFYAAGALAVFGFLAWKFRPRDGQKPVPVMLAIAAVTLSTMHQSSLGSLFLLMPDKLDRLWWSPAMPIGFFLSSIAAGLAVIVLVEMWIARSFQRPLRVPQLAALGQAAFWALLAYQVFRTGDVLLRGALHGHRLPSFALEVVAGGLIPLVLLSRKAWREQPRLLLTAALLSAAGVVFNRINATNLALDLPGPLPQVLPPQAYVPAPFEWGISAGLIATAIFLFAWAVRVFPVLPREEKAS
jgi:formate dehydrogenase iron-sulfur subunit